MQPAYFDAALRTYVQKICNCTNFKVNTSLFEYIDNDRALYTVQLTGPAIDELLQLWSDGVDDTQGIYITVGTILLCNSSCFNHDKRTSKSSGTLAATYLIVIFTILSIFTHNNFDCFTFLLDKRLENVIYVVTWYYYINISTYIATYFHT